MLQNTDLKKFKLLEYLLLWTNFANQRHHGSQNSIWKISKSYGCFWWCMGTIFAASNADRIEIVYDTYLEVSIKESTRIGRTKENFFEIIDLNLDLLVPPEIKTFWTSSVNRERLQILSRNYFLMKGKEKEKNIILFNRYVTYKDGVCSW